MSLLWMALLLGSLANPASVLAHDDGVLSVASRILSVGDSVTVRGEEFRGGARVTLVLVGIDGRRPLGEVVADSVGRFQVRVSVADDARPGVYRIVAVAADGDEISGVDVEVKPRDATDGKPGAGDEGDGVPTASAEPLQLTRAKSRAVTIGALLMTGLSFLFGILLLREPANRS